MNKLTKNNVRDLFLYFCNFSKVCLGLKSIIKNKIILFFIFRKLSQHSNLNLKVIGVLFFINYFIFKNNSYKYTHIFQNQILIEINMFIFDIKSKLNIFKQNYVKKKKSGSIWIIKKEYFEIELNRIHFFVLFDKLKFFLQSKKMLYRFFHYLRYNQGYLKKKSFFQKLFFFYTKVYFSLFDNFVFYLAQIFCKKLKKYIKQKLNTNLSIKDRSLFLLRCTSFFFYKRFGKSFFFRIFVKSRYLKTLSQEIFYFIKKKMKFSIKNSFLSIINAKKKFRFLGFKLLFLRNEKTLIYEINIQKIIARFFLLNYKNKYKKPVAHFKQFFLYKQIVCLIKLKLILQSVIFYYKIAKNKKYVVFKILSVLRISITQVFNQKFFIKSRAKLFSSFKKDLSQFITKKV